MTPLELLTLITSGDPASLKQASEYIDTLRYADKVSLEPLCRALREAKPFGHERLYSGPLHRKYLEIIEVLNGICVDSETTV